jgi:RNA polymerase sigma-70 factor (TIGR02943 family)
MEFTQKQNNAAAWVNDYSDILYSYVVRRVKDPHTAKDLVQETFLAAWRNADTYNGQASVKTWLFTILKNKIIDYYRKVATHKAAGFDQPDASPDHFFDSEDHWATHAYPADWATDYENPLESQEFYAILTQCKSKLKEIQKVVFSMKYLDGLESDEICQMLQLSSANYWVLVHRAKTQLRACLEKNWFV